MSELLENLKKLRNNGSRKQAHIDLACRCINEVEKLEKDLAHKELLLENNDKELECAMKQYAREAVKVKKYKELWELADKYINESPCDPDIYPKQWEAWNYYQKKLKENER